MPVSHILHTPVWGREQALVWDMDEHDVHKYIAGNQFTEQFYIDLLNDTEMSEFYLGCYSEDIIKSCVFRFGNAEYTISPKELREKLKDLVQKRKLKKQNLEAHHVYQQLNKITSFEFFLKRLKTIDLHRIPGMENITLDDLEDFFDERLDYLTYARNEYKKNGIKYKQKLYQLVLLIKELQLNELIDVPPIIEQRIDDLYNYKFGNYNEIHKEAERTALSRHPLIHPALVKAMSMLLSLDENTNSPFGRHRR